jgi:hypothetical protein
VKKSGPLPMGGSGAMISRPGVRIGLGVEEGIELKSLALAQYAAWPLMVAIVVALAIAFLMRERYLGERRAVVG